MILHRYDSRNEEIKELNQHMIYMIYIPYNKAPLPPNEQITVKETSLDSEFEVKTYSKGLR